MAKASSTQTTATRAADPISLAQTILLAAIYDQMVAERFGSPRSELVLAEAGFSYGQIAAVLGRNPEAVRSIVRRKAGKSSGNQSKAAET